MTEDKFVVGYRLVPGSALDTQPFCQPEVGVIMTTLWRHNAEVRLSTDEMRVTCGLDGVLKAQGLIRPAELTSLLVELAMAGVHLMKQTLDNIEIGYPFEQVLKECLSVAGQRICLSLSPNLFVVIPGREGQPVNVIPDTEKTPHGIRVSVYGFPSDHPLCAWGNQQIARRLFDKLPAALATNALCAQA